MGCGGRSSTPTLDVDDLCPPLTLGEVTTNRFHVIAAVSGGGQTQAIGGRLKATPIAVVNVARLRRRMPVDLARWRATDVTLIEGDYTEAPDVDATLVHRPALLEVGPGRCTGGGRATSTTPRWGRGARNDAGRSSCAEGEGADWLPFERLADVIGVSGKRSQEVVWYGGDPAAHGKLV